MGARKRIALPGLSPRGRLKEKSISAPASARILNRPVVDPATSSISTDHIGNFLIVNIQPSLNWLFTILQAFFEMSKPSGYLTGIKRSRRRRKKTRPRSEEANKT